MSAPTDESYTASASPPRDAITDLALMLVASTVVTRHPAGNGWRVSTPEGPVARDVTWPLSTLEETGLITWLDCGDSSQIAWLTVPGKATLGGDAA